MDGWVGFGMFRWVNQILFIGLLCITFQKGCCYVVNIISHIYIFTKMSKCCLNTSLFALALDYNSKCKFLVDYVLKTRTIFIALLNDLSLLRLTKSYLVVCVSYLSQKPALYWKATAF